MNGGTIGRDIESETIPGAGPDGGSEAPGGARPEGTPSRRILMVAPTSFFADYGCHVRILEEARVLSRMGHRVRITTYRNGHDIDGLDIRRTLPIPWRTGYEVGSSRHKLGFDALLGLTTLRAALAWRPDVVHGHLHEGALIGGAVARLIRRPLVFDFQGSLTAEMVDHHFLDPAGRLHGPIRRLERMIDHLPAAVVTSSARAVPHLLEDFGVPAARVRTLPDCVDAERFRPDLLTEERRARHLAALGIPPGRRIVLYLGLLARHQGTDRLLRAARRLLDRRADVHFLIMGFPGTETYSAMADSLGLSGHVTFTGRVPYEDAPMRLALGDVAVAPKLSETEGSGKILNYMAAGLPTVAFDQPVNREYMGDDGIYAPPGDDEGLAAAIEGLLDDRERREAIGARLRQRAIDGYDWSRAGARLEEIYEHVIAGRSPSGLDDGTGR